MAQFRDGFEQASGRDGEWRWTSRRKVSRYFWFLGRRQRAQAAFLASASLLQRDFSGGVGVANPLCPAARRDREALATEFEEINGRGINLSARTSAKLEQVVVGESEAESDEESEDAIEDAFNRREGTRNSAVVRGMG